MELIKKEDFEQPNFEVGFRNLTSRTELGDPSKIALSEFDAESVSLELPKNSGSIGHGVLVEIFRAESRVSKRCMVFTGTGKIETLADLENQSQLARIKLVQFDSQSWDDFLGVFSSRQDEITMFLDSSRG